LAKAAKKAAVPKAPKVKAEKPAKAPKAVKPAKPVKGAPVGPADRDQQALARHHRDKYIGLREALNKASRAMQAFGKVVKGDGLTMRQIKLMVELQTPEGEAAFRATVAADLQAAQWQGAAVGAQLSLFLEPDRTDSGDVAYEAGVQDSMDGKTASPKYAPDLPQHARYMEGYHAETERRIKSGIVKLEDTDTNVSKLITKDERETAAKDKADAAAARSAARAPVTPGMSRKDFVAQQRTEKQGARAAAEALFTGPGKIH